MNNQTAYCLKDLNKGVSRLRIVHAANESKTRSYDKLNTKSNDNSAPEENVIFLNEKSIAEAKKNQEAQRA